MVLSIHEFEEKPPPGGDMPQQLRQNSRVGCGNKNHIIRAGVILTIKRRSSAWKQQQYSSRFRPFVKVASDRVRVIKQRLEENDVPERVVF